MNEEDDDGTRYAVEKWAWQDIIYRARISTSRKAVCQVLVDCARPDGTSVRPGAALVAARTGLSGKVAQAHIGWLRKVGLLHLVKSGAGRRRRDGGGLHANVYRLIQNPFLLDANDITILSPSEMDAEVERIRESLEGEPRTAAKPAAAAAEVVDGPEMHPATTQAIPAARCGQPGDNVGTDTGAAVHSPEMPPLSRDALTPSEPGNAPALTDAKPVNAPALQGVNQEMPPVDGGANQSTYTPHSTEPPEPVAVDLRTDLTVSRASPLEKTEIPIVPPRCSHGLKITKRPDGSAACVLCRLAARTTTGPLGAIATAPTGNAASPQYREPPIAAATARTEHSAKIIPFRRPDRRAS